MTATIIQPNQYLKIGMLQLPFPSEDMSVEDVVECYQLNYPILADSDISAPRLEGDILVYEAVPPPVKTKGKETKSSGHSIWQKRRMQDIAVDPVVYCGGQSGAALSRLLKRSGKGLSLRGAKLCLPPF